MNPTVTINFCDLEAFLAVAMARSLKSTVVSTWRGDHQVRPGHVSLRPFVGMNLNL